MAFGRRLPNNFTNLNLNLKIRFTLPVIITTAAFFVYALSLSWGVTLNSLAFTMKIAGWDWQPMVNRPLAWLLTLPFRLLPGSWIPSALNLFSALVAAATLGILARSVQRLPWDCPPDATKKWALWLPALVACALCGLEISFWQNATEMTGEMVDLFMLAAGIACVLEFRAEKNKRWLDIAAIVWGIGMAESWVMQLTLPFFLVALAWLPGIKRIGKRFVLRLILLSLAAMVVFSLPAILTGLSPHSAWSVKELWLASFRFTKGSLANLYGGFWSWHRMLTVVLLMYFLLPVLACLVRIQNEAAKNVHGMEKFQVKIFRALRVGMLVVCVWLMFDPEVGPRKILLKQFNLPMPLLTFDYLLGLGTAFLLGSLLYASQIPPRQRARTGLEKLGSFLRRRAFALVAIFSILAITGLLARNTSAIYFARQASLIAVGDLIVSSLPADGGILLGDDAALLLAVKSSLTHHRERGRWQTVEVQQISNPKYRAALEADLPTGWTTNSTVDLNPTKTIELLIQIARTRHVYYLLPEPGHFLFEQFYPEPQGAVHELKRFSPEIFALPKLTEQQIATNEQFWQAAWDKNIATASRIVPAAEKSFPHRLALSPVKQDAAQQITKWYSIAINNWGVELQRNGKLTEAKHRFEAAKSLNPDNPAVAANLFCNSNLLAGESLDLSGTASLSKSVSGIQQLARIIENFGTFDEPSVCVMLGEACFNVGWPRQAMQQFDRARTLAPEAGVPELAMAKIYSRLGFDQKTLELVKGLRRFETNSPAGRALTVELSLLEAKAWLGLTNATEANHVLETVLQKNPDEPLVWETVFKAYLAFGSPTNALGLLDRMLTKDPDNIPALNNKAAVLVQIQRGAEAIPILDHAITLTNLPAIRLNRAIALLQAKDLPGAEAAYQELQTSTLDKFNVHFGLAQVAEARHDTNAAIRFYTDCLTNTVPQSAKWRDANARLSALQKLAPPN